jgi:cyclopropane fatty-acyl-phospholipid synthase-like methyltransferase
MSTAKFYDQISDVFNDTDLFNSCVLGETKEKFYDFLEKNFKEFENPNILDCGCGNGSFVDYLRSNNYSAFGVVNSPKTYEIAIRKFPLANIELDDMIKYMKNNIRKFDVIFAIQSFGYVNPYEFFESSYNSLNNNGVLIIYDFSLMPHIKNDEYYSKYWRYSFYKNHIHCFMANKNRFICEKIEMLKNVNTSFFNEACEKNNLNFQIERNIAYPTLYKFKKV